MKNVFTTEIFNNISDIRQRIKKLKSQQAVIGFVPTMGALHVGHESLIKRAKEDCDAVIVSIFVNPKQFGPSEDYDNYPRQLELDREICSKLGVDLIFSPTVEEMYTGESGSLEENCTMLTPPESLQNKLCGKSRKGHFNGVATVVLKLFNIITPDKAYFGMKDAQQFVIIKKMAEDLNIPVQIIGCLTVREADGLACSSRNKYLSVEARNKASCIYKSLKRIKESYDSGINSVSQLICLAKEELSSDVEVEYLEILDMDTLTPLNTAKPNALIAIAARINGVRLIDNLIIDKCDIKN